MFVAVGKYLCMLLIPGVDGNALDREHGVTCKRKETEKHVK